MNKPPMKGLLEKMLETYTRQLDDYKIFLKQVSHILENETYLQGGWPKKYWLNLKKDLQVKIENLKRSIETLEKVHKYF